MSAYYCCLENESVISTHRVYRSKSKLAVVSNSILRTLDVKKCFVS